MRSDGDLLVGSWRIAVSPVRANHAGYNELLSSRVKEYGFEVGVVSSAKGEALHCAVPQRSLDDVLVRVKRSGSRDSVPDLFDLRSGGSGVFWLDGRPEAFRGNLSLDHLSLLVFADLVLSRPALVRTVVRAEALPEFSPRGPRYLSYIDYNVRRRVQVEAEIEEQILRYGRPMLGSNMSFQTLGLADDLAPEREKGDRDGGEEKGGTPG